MSSVVESKLYDALRQIPLECKSCHSTCTLEGALYINEKAFCPKCRGSLAKIKSVEPVVSRTVRALRQVDSQVAAAAPMPTADFDRC